MDTIDKVRSFNRFYTRQIGLVGRNYVSGGLGLTDLRVLYELRQASSLTARQLARYLGLDEGYLSRILAKFSKNGWLDRKSDPGDRRISQLNLSVAGQALADQFTAQARSRIGEMLGALDSIDQARMVDAMQGIERLLTGGSEDVILHDLRPGDSGWLIQQHGELYQREEGFDHSFEALVAEILADFIRNHDREYERAFIAQRGGQRLGSIFCVRQDSETAKLRLFLLVPEARGAGLGRKLLEACMGFARERGYRRMVLWTHKSHNAACALYAKAGFQITSEQNVHEFGVDLVSQNWEIAL